MYAKLINNNIQYAPKNYITEQGVTIFNFNTDEKLMQEYGFKPLIQAVRPSTGRQYVITYEETKTEIREILTYTETEEEYEERIERQERQRKDQMMLTPSDVERALYYSELHMDFDDLKALIAQQLPQVDLKGLAIEFRANNFYRGATDINGNRIIDMVGAILGYTPEDMDYLFEHKQLPVHEQEPSPEEEN